MKQLLLLLSLSSLLLCEQVVFLQVQKVRSNDILNIREKADHTSKSIAKIPFDAKCVVSHGCGKNIDFSVMMHMEETEIQIFLDQAKEQWCYVDFDGISGWSNSYYLKESKADCK